jgi:hypothetical protein
MAGKKFAADFERIDEVKSNDKVLIWDSDTGVVKYATPAQINAKFDDLVADIDTAVQAASDAEDARDLALGYKNDAVQAKDDAVAAKGDAVQAKNDAVQAKNDAQAAAAALSTFIVQTEGSDVAKVMSQKAVTDLLTFLHRSLGKYAAITSKTLSQATAGKYVNTDGGETANASYGISAPISVNKGDTLLVPSASAVLAACSVVSRKITRTYAKVINYEPQSYDAYDRIATAWADYDHSLLYTYHYASVDDSTPDYYIIDGNNIPSLPATRTVTESFYEPLVRQAVSAMPDTGYYVYIADDSMDVVISGFTATVNGGVCLVHGIGAFKNIVSNFAGHLGVKILCQAVSQAFENIEALRKLVDNGGDHKADSYDAADGFKVCGYPTILYGAGTPSATTIPSQYGIPAFIGQIYIDTTAASGGLYYAKGTAAISDWKNA